MSKITLIMIVVWVLGCTNQETSSDQFNNNSSGMDQDHTSAPPDTVMLDEAKLNDTTQLSSQNKSIDSVSKE